MDLSYFPDNSLIPPFMCPLGLLVRILLQNASYEKSCLDKGS